MSLIATTNAKLQGLVQEFASASDAELANVCATRRRLVLGSFLAALPAAVLAGAAHAVDATETQITLPDQMQWKPWSAGGAAGAMESAAVFGAIDKPGPYAILVRWHPGYMSAPHRYVTDRLCFVISGTWWVNSGETFMPESTVPVPSGGFVRRVAHTPHYDGVRRGSKEPAVIGIFGQAPIELTLVDPSKPPVREV
jgi:hypothetical protein